MLDRYDGQFRSAPVYDMLPMLFAPQNDEIVARVFVPAAPTADTLAALPKKGAYAYQPAENQ